MRNLLLLVPLFVPACARPVLTEVPSRASWEEVAWCVSAEPPELAPLVRDALEAWGVDADAPAGAETRCVPVGLVDGYMAEDGTPDGDTAGLTLANLRHGPLLVTFARWFWEACPTARARLVMHEIGHALGYLTHSPDDAEVMAPGIDCEQGGAVMPTLEEIRFAESVRSGRRLTIDGRRITVVE